MNLPSGEVARHRTILAESQNLVRQAREAWRGVDEAWAARKDAIAKSKASSGTHSLIAPASRPNHQQQPPTCDSTVEGGPEPLLLIVEDDADDYQLLQLAIARAGVRAAPSWARTGSEALELFVGMRASQVCIICDVRLPDMTGFDVLSAIRHSGLKHHAPFIFLTGNSDPALPGRARSLGADGFFLKTCRQEDLRRVALAADALLRGQAMAT